MAFITGSGRYKLVRKIGTNNIGLSGFPPFCPTL